LIRTKSDVGELYERIHDEIFNAIFVTRLRLLRSSSTKI
jgi:hypothetical protein